MRFVREQVTHAPRNSSRREREFGRQLGVEQSLRGKVSLWGCLIQFVTTKRRASVVASSRGRTLNWSEFRVDGGKRCLISQSGSQSVVQGEQSQQSSAIPFQLQCNSHGFRDSVRIVLFSRTVRGLSHQSSCLLFVVANARDLHTAKEKNRK